MNESWLKCRLHDGMFSDEVVIELSSGRSYFVNLDRIKRNDGERGIVRVRTLESGGATWAIMPTEDVDVIQVESGDLERITS